MPYFDQYIKFFYRFLQTYDTSLGVDIRENEIILVRTRKQLRGYKILQELTVPYHNEDLNEVLNKTINEHKLNSTYYTLNVPRNHTLMRRVKIPLMPEENYLPFLYQNPDLYLLPNMEVNDVVINFKPLKISDDTVEGTVLIARKQQITDFLKQLKIAALIQLIYDGLALDSLVRIYFPDYSGIIFYIVQNNVSAMHYQQGGIINYQYSSCANEIEGEIKKIIHNTESPDDYENGKNSTTIIFSTDNRTISTSNGFLNDFEDHNFYKSLSTSAPIFNHAFALSLTSYNGFDNPFDLNPKENKETNRNLLYKQLTKKCAVFCGVLIFLLFLFLTGTKGMLSWKYDQLKSDFSILQPLIAERDSLIVQRAMLNQLRHDLVYRSSQKSYYSFYLYQIARRLPDQLWVSNINIETAKGSKNTIVLKGFAFSDSEVASFLKQLENMSNVRNLVLDEMTVLSRKEIYKMLKKNYKSLVQFKVHFDV